VESISSNHTFDFYPPTNLLQLLFLRPLRLCLPSRHPFLQRLKFTLLRITHAPFVLGVTLFEQIFHNKNEGKHTGAGMLRPPSSRSPRAVVQRASMYSQLLVKSDDETHRALDEPRSSGSAEPGDLYNRLTKLEQEISSVKSMVREVLNKL
jgi:hypothetical protein